MAIIRSISRCSPDTLSLYSLVNGGSIERFYTATTLSNETEYYQDTIMEFNNPFVLPDEQYTRDIDLFNHYIADTAKYLSVMTGDPIEICKRHVVNTIRQRDTEYGIKDPTVVFMHRDEKGDRSQKTGKLSKYIKAAIDNGDIIAPTLTIYTNPDQQKSILAGYIDRNVKIRSAAKKMMFKAKMDGDDTLYKFKKSEQANAKIFNNALSGSHVSGSTPLFNKSAHSTLTSTCRSTSGYGNANNEKLLCGNRHYWSPDIVKNNLMSIINNTDYDRLQTVMTKYNMHYPTVEETMECIQYSAMLYWRDKREYAKIHRVVSKLTDIERAAFVYTGDLYHIKKHNSQLIHDWITRLSVHIHTQHPDPDAVFKIAPDDYKNLAMQLCASVTRGKTLDKIKPTPIYGELASTTENIMRVMVEYRDLIQTFFVTRNLPASLAYFPDSIRRAALTSDTDSTIFTVQDWVIWYYGELRFGDEANAIAAVVVFIAAQSITHILSIMSANIGVEHPRLHQIAMKNEFKFDVFIPTSVSKHYYALISCQEGNIYKDFEMEIKGVHLKSSNAPKAINTAAREMMKEIMYTIVAGKKLSISYYLKKVADIERGIMDSISKGSFDYFRMGQIKTPKSYKLSPEQSPYIYHLLWNEVFGSKYGLMTEPPYSVIKVSINLPTQTALNNWLTQIQDRDIANRMSEFLLRNNRKNLNTLLLPAQIVQATGIPEEILLAIDVRKIILDVTKVFSIIMESLGIYMLGDKKTVLFSDMY